MAASRPAVLRSMSRAAGASGQASAGAPRATCTVVVGTRPVVFSMSRRGHNWPAAKARRRTSTPGTAASGGAMRPSPPAKRSTSASMPAAMPPSTRPAMRSATSSAARASARSAASSTSGVSAGRPGRQSRSVLRRGHQKRLQAGRREPQHGFGKVITRREAVGIRGVPRPCTTARRLPLPASRSATSESARGPSSLASNFGSQALMAPAASLTRSARRSVALVSSEPPAMNSGACQPRAATISLKKFDCCETRPARCPTSSCTASQPAAGKVTRPSAPITGSASGSVRPSATSRGFGKPTSARSPALGVQLSLRPTSSASTAVLSDSSSLACGGFTPRSRACSDASAPSINCALRAARSMRASSAATRVLTTVQR